MHGLTWAEAPGPTTIRGLIMSCSIKKGREHTVRTGLRCMASRVRHNSPANETRSDQLHAFQRTFQRAFQRVCQHVCQRTCAGTRLILAKHPRFLTHSGVLLTCKLAPLICILAERARVRMHARFANMLMISSPQFSPLNFLSQYI